MDAHHFPRLNPGGPGTRPSVTVAKPEVYQASGIAMPTRISPEEVRFHPHSFADPHGRVFRWRGHLLRALTPEGAARFDRVQKDGLLGELMARGLLIETTATSFHMPGYARVVRHRELPFVSYPQEWCPAMFKRAVVAIVDLAVTAARHGLALKDAHPWNVVFDGTAPVYVDVGSIAPCQDPGAWPGRDEFDRYCLYPLLLMSRGYEHLARRMLPTETGVTAEDIRHFGWDGCVEAASAGRMAQARYLTKIAQRLWRVLGTRTRRTPTLLEELTELREVVAALPLPGPDGFAAFSRRACPAPAPEVLTRRVQALRQVVASHQPNTLLVVGGSGLADVALPPLCPGGVVVLSPDPGHVTRLYEQVEAARAPVHPVMMDVANPTPSMGWGSYWSIAACERLRCEMVVAVDLVDELVLRRHFSLAQIVEGLSAYASRWLVVEWIEPAPDAGEAVPRPVWLTRDEFMRALRREFRQVRDFSRESGSTTVIVCER